MALTFNAINALCSANQCALSRDHRGNQENHNALQFHFQKECSSATLCSLENGQSSTIEYMCQVRTTTFIYILHVSAKSYTSSKSHLLHVFGVRCAHVGVMSKKSNYNQIS